MGLFKRRAHPAPPLQPTPSISPENPVAPDFNALVNLTRHDPARLQDLWNAVFHLPAWHFVVTDADLALEQSRPPSVLLCRIERRPFMVAFTDEAIASACTRANPDLFNDKRHAFLELPTPDAALYVAQHITSNVYGIVFNQTPGHHGFYAPLTNILPMYNHAHGVLPRGITPSLLSRAFDFDPLLRRARTSPDPAIRDTILKTLTSLDMWAFLTSEQSPQTPLSWPITEDQSAIMAFTDDRQLARMAQLAMKQNIRGPFNALHLKRADIPHTLTKIKQGGLDALAFNLAGESLLYSIDELLTSLSLTLPHSPTTH